ncbi:uncharacterized protein HD556DRAFT_1250835 [Suillus plorans]|uniref:Uncharacterized protein n=1 Tax=Suillus plorans TaxID=116603 RepID=A0A9P7A991_9AGAM|nr:uncharacterized protein HD556DRAFT_1250835 [Suillus plorans]KAG1784777.1 hypothetical protein HD556DRAFT_1250835 [Suillus plorans]
MPRIINDPNLNICPDYASPHYANAQAQLVNDNVTEEQSIQLLRTIWRAANNADIDLWEGQVEVEREQRENLRRIQEEEQDRIEQERIDEEESARKEEKKKHKHKFMPIPEDTGVPDEPSIIPSSYAIRKLNKGEYLKLWYFTNDGLDEAHSKKTIDDDAMVMSTLPDGSTAWVSATAARNASSVVDDENLSFEEFCIAYPRFIAAIEEADWPQDRVRMMAFFWKNIQIHPYRSMRDPLAQKALLVYQAEQRKRWHVVAKSAAGPYNLSTINQKVLDATRERVYWLERTKKDNQRDYKVSKLSIAKFRTITKCFSRTQFSS